MKKSKLVAGILIVSLFLVSAEVFAGGVSRTASKEVIGTPPESMERTTNIARHKGDGTFFYPLIDFFSRIITHYIPAGDKKPGPGYGVAEEHNIGNAPQPPVIGKVMDRSGRGKGEMLEILGDPFERIKQHEDSKAK